MIPMIRDECRMQICAGIKSRNVHGVSFAFFLLILFFFSVPIGRANFSSQSQDSNSKPAPAPAPATQPPASTQPKPSNETPPQEVAPLKKAVRDKKVITEEDLTKPEKPLKLNKGDDEENNSICDLSCEAELKSQMGITRDRELEFRNQLTLVRSEIGNDRAWNSALDGALSAAGPYCDLQRQKAEILSKGDASEYARSMVNSRFAKQESDLSVQYRNYAGLAKQHIAAVQRFAPLRAAVMQYQLDDSTNRVCPDFNLP